jgi:hypothetical protein
VYKKNENLVAKIIVQPEMDRFNYHCLIEENEKVKCKIKMYCGLTDLYYYRDLFSDVKWKSENEIIITGKKKEVEISIIVSECEIAFKNLTRYKKAPFFELMRADITKEEREIANIDWHHSIPPAFEALLRENNN